MAFAAKIGIAKSSLLLLLESRGVPMRHQSHRPKQRRRILQFRKQGMTIRTAAGKVRCS